MDPINLTIPSLGECTFDSPLASDHSVNFVEDDDRILFDDRVDNLPGDVPVSSLPAYEKAGPRPTIHFDPAETVAGIVTCGGLCPGLNDVIRGLVMELHYRYGVQRVLGFRYGYEGLVESFGHLPMELTPDLVDDIHELGGTVLGTSRGNQDKDEIVDCLEKHGVNILFTIGGDGTQRGALQIAERITARGLDIAVVGVPKTIDNDILYIDKSFGFETAFSVANKAVQCAHTEAISARNGIGLVKLMGRDSGWIAAHTALACSLANIVLVPEVPFALYGQRGVLPFLKERLQSRHHAVILVAEGAGQALFQGDLGTDASGNTTLHDVGLFLRDTIKAYLKAEGIDHTVKYIDPSYIIRSVPASPKDSLYALRLAQGAVHAAMTGRTEMVIGRVRERFVHVPMTAIAGGRKKIDPAGDDWMAVLETTGQPAVFA